MNEADLARIEAAIAGLAGQSIEVPSNARRAAVAILMRGGSLDETEVLLMRRAQREGDRWSGQIGLPGGHEEDSDPDLVATARRESVEEVGVDPGEGRSLLLGQLPVVQARSRNVVLPLFIWPIVFHRADPPEPVPGPEADEAFWFPLHRAARGDLRAEFPYEHEGLVHRLPAWDFEGRTIWGMTHGILNRLLVALATTPRESGE